MSGDRFWKTVVARLIAMFTMTVTGFWQSGLRLNPVDVGAMLAKNMMAAHPNLPCSLAAGNLVHFANGVIIAMI